MNCGRAVRALPLECWGSPPPKAQILASRWAKSRSGGRQRTTSLGGGPPGAGVDHAGANVSVTTGAALGSSDGVDNSGAGALDLAARDYDLTMSADAEYTGNQSFRLRDLAKAPAITRGQRIDGHLTPASETDYDQFDAHVGDRFYFDSLGGIPRLLGLDGKATWPGPVVAMGSDEEPRAFRQSGVYALLVEGRSSATGTAD
ncbi:hypothetical protein BH11PSE8_BH11PSE8_32710 [soil metagenome]